MSLRGAEIYQKLLIRVENLEVDRELRPHDDAFRSHRVVYVLTMNAPPPVWAKTRSTPCVVAKPGEVFVVKKKRRPVL